MNSRSKLVRALYALSLVAAMIAAVSAESLLRTPKQEGQHTAPHRRRLEDSSSSSSDSSSSDSTSDFDLDDFLNATKDGENITEKMGEEMLNITEKMGEDMSNITEKMGEDMLNITEKAGEETNETEALLEESAALDALVDSLLADLNISLPDDSSESESDDDVGGAEKTGEEVGSDSWWNALFANISAEEAAVNTTEPVLVETDSDSSSDDEDTSEE